MLTDKDKIVLEKARITYGSKAQIAVAAEECCELAKELLKYLRFEHHNEAVEKTKANVTSEVADVINILDHVINIFGITEDELRSVLDVKLKRLEHWTKNNPSIEYTTKVRNLPEKSCTGCFWNDHWEDPYREHACEICYEKGTI